MAVNFENCFSISDVLKEFMNLFDKCCEDGNEPKYVPVQDLIKKIVSSSQMQSFSGTSRDLEDIMRKILDCPVSSNNMQMLSRKNFELKIKKYIDSLQTSYTGAQLSREKNQIQELIQDNQKFEVMCSSLREKIQFMQNVNESLLNEKNALQLSFRDAIKTESELEHHISRLENDFRKSEERISNLNEKLFKEKELLKKEREKCLELQRRLNLTDEHMRETKQQLMIANEENQLLIQNLDNVEKQLELLNSQYTSTASCLQQCQSDALNLQEQLDSAIKQKQDTECQLKDTLYRLRLITLLYEDLEMANNLLKDKLLSNAVIDVNEQSMTAVQVPSKSLNCNNGCDISDEAVMEQWSKGVTRNSYQGMERLSLCTNTPMRSTNHGYIKGSDYNSVDIGLTNTKAINFSLQDEIQEVEGKLDCSRIGCYSRTSSFHSGISHLSVEKIEKQQLVIKELAENIAKYSVDGDSSDYYNQCDNDVPSDTSDDSKDGTIILNDDGNLEASIPFGEEVKSEAHVYKFPENVATVLESGSKYSDEVNDDITPSCSSSLSSPRECNYNISESGLIPTQQTTRINTIITKCDYGINSSCDSVTDDDFDSVDRDNVTLFRTDCNYIANNDGDDNNDGGDDDDYNDVYDGNYSGDNQKKLNNMSSSDSYPTSSSRSSPQSANGSDGSSLYKNECDSSVKDDDSNENDYEVKEQQIRLLTTKSNENFTSSYPLPVRSVSCDCITLNETFAASDCCCSDTINNNCCICDNGNVDSFHHVTPSLSRPLVFNNGYSNRNKITTLASENTLMFKNKMSWLRCLLIVVGFFILIFVSFLYIFYHYGVICKRGIYSKTESCQPISAYYIEELVQPYIELRWDHPPPI